MNKQTDQKSIEKYLSERKDIFNLACMDTNLQKQVELAVTTIRKSFNQRGKLLIFGNGGSAAEAQHFSAELVGRFGRQRRALPAIALTTDTSILTAQANDESFETIFSRQIEALASEGDVVIALTTSDVGDDGHSKNILHGLMSAKDKGSTTIGFFSQKTNKLLDFTDVSIIVPQTDTALIQEMHLALIHIICDLIESDLEL